MQRSLRQLALLSVAALTMAAAPAGGGDAQDVPTDEPAPTTAQHDGQHDDAGEHGGTPDDSSTEEDTAASEPDASATGAEVEGVIVVSRAEASDDSASATVLEVGGERLVGGDADGGSNEGAVADTGETELGRLVIAPWSAETSEDGSRSETSVARVTVIGEDTFYAHVLRSRAAADRDGGTAASSDGVVLGIGGEDEVRVLSSTWTTDGPESAVVRQGDDTIGEDTDGQCHLEFPSVLHLLCLTGADGQGGTLVPGDDSDKEYASIAELVLLEEQGTRVLSAGAERGGDPAPVDDTAQSPAPDGEPEDTTPTVLSEQLTPAADDGPLPNTGGGLTLLAFALLLLAAGLTLRRTAAVRA